MASSTDEPTVVRVSRKGQATIPKALREKFGIETPGEVFVYEAQGRLVIEPVPSFDELHGIHAGETEAGDVLERVRELKADGNISLADAYAVALAHERDATLVVGADDDFDALPVAVDIRRFRDEGV